MVAILKQHKQLSFLIVLAALLRLPALTIESLWYDETFTAWLAGLDLPSMVTATLGDVHPPTWYLIEWGVVRLLGMSEFSLRIIPALAGVALIPAVWRLAGTLEFSEAQKFGAALLAAVSPFAVYYSQEARMYSLLYFCTTLATIAIIERRWLLFITAAALSLWLHNLAVFYIAALGWLALYRCRLDWRMVLSFLVVGLIWLPWVSFGLLNQAADVADGFWSHIPSPGAPVYIMVAWLFSEKSFLLAFVTVPVFTLAVCLSFTYPLPHRVELLGVFLIPISLCAIVSMTVAPVMIERVIGSSAAALYLLLSPVVSAPRRIDLGRAKRWMLTGEFLPATFLPVAFAVILGTFYPLYWGTDKVGRWPWDHNIEVMLAERRPNDGMFHANPATYIIYYHYLPDLDQYIWRQANDLSQSLTDQTKRAMGMKQAYFEQVACNHPRWWIAFFENPTTSAGERSEIARIVDQYDGRLVSTMYNTNLVHARIYLIEAPCQQLVEQ